MNQDRKFQRFEALVSAFSSRLEHLSGWRRFLVSFGIGSCLAFAMPPFDLFPLLFIGMPCLAFLLKGAQNLRQAFVIGWSFAWGFLVFSLYWIAASMFVDIGYFWWAVPLAVLGLPALFALYYGIATVLAKLIPLKNIAGILSLALLWFLADFARGHVFTGFPWNILGYTWSGSLAVLQSTSVIGIYGLSLLTTVAAFLPATLANSSRSARVAVGAALSLFVVFAAIGGFRLATTSVGTVPDVRIRLVQPNIDQRIKWKASERAASFAQLLELTSAPAEKPITHFVWPETASTYYLGEDNDHRQQIAERIPSSAFVITGVVRHSEDPDGEVHYYNSLVAVDGMARLVAGYDKTHLVPFGEFMPFRRYIPIHSLASSSVDFTRGYGPVSLSVLGLPLFSPLICYEAIFPGDVVDQAVRPGFMLNATNDGWYGNTIGPYQHFAIVRVRAIEEGMPLLRAANTGISGVIDPLGRVLRRLGLGKPGFIDTDLPNELPPTFFSRWKDIPLWICFTGIVATIVCRFRTDIASKDME